MQLHSAKIISSFHYILRWMGQNLKTFRTWICINPGQLEDFSKIQINPLEKLVPVPSAFLESFTHPLFLNIFLLAHFSLFLYLMMGRTLRSSLEYFGDDQRPGGDICYDRYASQALGWPWVLNTEGLGGLASGASGIWKHLYKSCFIVFSPQEMEPKRRTLTELFMSCIIISSPSRAVVPREGSRASQGTDSKCSRLMSSAFCPWKETGEVGEKVK